MSPSILLSNALFCGIAALLLLPLLKHPNVLIYKKGIPLFVIVGAVLLKLIIPYEFSFTRTLASKHVLPFIRNIFHMQILKGITIGLYLVCFNILDNTFLLFICVCFGLEHIINSIFQNLFTRDVILLFSYHPLILS